MKTATNPPRRATTRASGAISLAVSLLVHAALLLALAGAVWTVRQRSVEPDEPAEIVLFPPAPAPAPLSPPATAPPAAAIPGAAPAPRPIGLAETPPPALRPSSPPAAAAFSSSTPLVRAPAFGASFAGAKVRRAASVVYVVDASGAMVSSLSFVVAEVARSVRELDESQRFQIVLYRDAAPGGQSSGIEVFRPSRDARPALARASDFNKDAAAAWLATVRPSGRSDPYPGLERALAFKPDVIFLLARSIPRSEGRGPEANVWGRPLEDVLAGLERLNPPSASGRRATAIKTVQFIEDDPSGVMQAIAQAHGDGPGAYSILTLDRIQPR